MKSCAKEVRFRKPRGVGLMEGIFLMKEVKKGHH